MRLIDADALKQYIAFQGIVGAGYSDDERVTDVWDMIDNAPTIQPTAQEPVWHDLRKNPDDIPDHEVLCYDESGEAWTGWANEPWVSDIIGWREIPKAGAAE